MDQFDRVFKVHHLLSKRRTGVPFETLREELAEQGLECSRATIKRTLADLRDRFHMPLRHDREHGGYYYDGDGVYELPGLWFTAQELSALLILEEAFAQQPLGVLSETLKPLRTKIDKLLQRASVGIPNWRSRVQLLRVAGRSVGSQFDGIAEALTRRRRVRIHYHARSDDRMAPRVVSPQRLILYRDNWYLNAWCHSRTDLRTFAVDRIIATEPVDEVAVEVEDEQINEILATSYGIFSGAPTAIAVLHFTAHAARWVAAEVWHPQQQDLSQDDGSLMRRLPYHRSQELIMDILRHGSEVEVLEPASLRDAVVAKLRAALERYFSTRESAGDRQPNWSARFGSAI